MKYLSNINLAKNEIQNAVIQKLASAPANPMEGQIYYDTVDDEPKYYNGTDWVSMNGLGASMTGSDIVTAINSSTSLIDDDNLSTNVGGAITNSHTHSNKTTLDTYDQTNANLTSAVTNTHTHANKSTLDTYDQTNANLTSAVSLKHSQNTDTGTTSASFTIGTSGVKVKNSTGTELQVRNNGDTDYADIRVKNLYVEGTTVQIDSNEVNIGDSNILLNEDITTNAANSNGGISVKRLMTDNETRKDAVLEYNISTDKWQSTQGDVTGTLVTAQLANKVVANVGDNSNTSIVVTHNLNTRDCNVSIREAGSPYALVMCDVECTTVNTITFIFATAPTTNQYVATIIG